MSSHTQRAARDTLSVAQRVLELLTVAGLLVVFGFFVDHQRSDTGFFTGDFGSFEMVCLYGPLLLGLAAPLVRARTGRRRPARLFEMTTSVALGLAGVWLLIAFPFDFAHLADVLPRPLRFTLDWINNDIGRVPLVIQIVSAPFGAFSALRKYIATSG